MVAENERLGRGFVDDFNAVPVHVDGLSGGPVAVPAVAPALAERGLGIDEGKMEGAEAGHAGRLPGAPGAVDGGKVGSLGGGNREKKCKVVRNR